MRPDDSIVKDPSGYQRLADLASVLTSPIRLEIIASLVQCDRTVETLADTCGLPIKTISHHLQKLRAAGLVNRMARGRAAVYSLRDDSVISLWAHLRSFADQQEAWRIDSMTKRNGSFIEPIGAEALESMIRDGRATLLDVRPTIEYEFGHLPGARSIPLEKLSDSLDDLPRDHLVVTVCRGPYCRLAEAAVSILNSRGFEAACYEGGMIEWRASGRDLSR